MLREAWAQGYKNKNNNSNYKQQMKEGWEPGGSHSWGLRWLL